MKSILGAEVGDQRLIRARCRSRQIGIEGGKNLPVALQVARVGRGAIEILLIDTAQDQARITAGLLPQFRVQVFEQSPGGTMPAEE